MPFDELQTCRICGCTYIEDDYLTEARFIGMCKKCKLEIQESNDDAGFDLWDV